MSLKRLSVFFVFVVVVFTQTQLYQVLKLPVLIQHFFEHKRENNRLSLSQFLLMHYACKDKHVQDDSRDMQLPYKVVNTHTLIVEGMPVQLELQLQRTTEYYTAPAGVMPDDFHKQDLHKLIWQPPRTA